MYPPLPVFMAFAEIAVLFALMNLFDLTFVGGHKRKSYFLHQPHLGLNAFKIPFPNLAALKIFVAHLFDDSAAAARLARRGPVSETLPFMAVSNCTFEQKR